jgi:hypothetical protein
VLRCLERSTNVYAKLDKEIFAQLMNGAGVPDEAIQTFMAKVTLSDDTYVD